jgi:gluconate 2-dehydrogenase subunit 3-like protein
LSVVKKGNVVSDKNSLVPIRVGGVSRREAIQWVLAAVAASQLPTASFVQAAPKVKTRPDTDAVPGGYGTDPNLVDVHKPGSIWPLTLTETERKTAKALADVILPQDQYGPAASAVGVPEMIDEWISAPYPQQQSDRPVIVEGLTWIEAESAKRFSKPFEALGDEQKRAICDDICYTAEAKPEFKKAARFFSRFRSLCASAYYATPAGWEAIGYVGNVPLMKFDGPPAEVLEKLGVTQTVR